MFLNIQLTFLLFRVEDKFIWWRSLIALTWLKGNSWKWLESETGELDAFEEFCHGGKQDGWRHYFLTFKLMESHGLLIRSSHPEPMWAISCPVFIQRGSTGSLIFATWISSPYLSQNLLACICKGKETIHFAFWALFYGRQPPGIFCWLSQFCAILCFL